MNDVLRLEQAGAGDYRLPDRAGADRVELLLDGDSSALLDGAAEAGAELEVGPDVVNEGVYLSLGDVPRAPGASPGR
jgi:hypothetical protein